MERNNWGNTIFNHASTSEDKRFSMIGDIFVNIPCASFIWVGAESDFKNITWQNFSSFHNISFYHISYFSGERNFEPKTPFVLPQCKRQCRKINSERTDNTTVRRHSDQYAERKQEPLARNHASEEGEGWFVETYRWEVGDRTNDEPRCDETSGMTEGTEYKYRIKKWNTPNKE